jgi:hypothetical protein
MAITTQNLHLVEAVFPRLALEVVAAMVNMNFLDVVHFTAQFAPAALELDYPAPVVEPFRAL